MSFSPRPGPSGRTGVEMEAMTACAVAALTVYDMVKGLERGVAIEAIELLAKSRRQERRLAPRRSAGMSDAPARSVLVSTSTVAGRERGEDESGAALAAFAGDLGAELAGREIIPDDRAPIAERLATGRTTRAATWS